MVSALAQLLLVRFCRIRFAPGILKYISEKKKRAANKIKDNKTKEKYINFNAFRVIFVLNDDLKGYLVQLLIVNFEVVG